MDNIQIGTNILLALLTAFYVWLTFRLVREAKAGNEQSQKSFKQQFQLSTYPLFACSVRKLKNGMPELIIRNSGEFPAQDVEVLLLSMYHTDELPIEKFIQDHVVLDSELKKRLFSNDEGFYSVYDRIVYFEFPQKKQVIITPELPLPTDNIKLLLQFRDVFGNNYVRTYWFFKHVYLDEVRFRLGSTEPQSVALSPRIEFDENLNFYTEDKSQLSDYINNDFVEIWKASIPIGHVNSYFQGVEDRGKWEDV